MNEVVIKVIGNYSYQTSRCLGEGVYGKVYEGMEKETKEKVAIKKIDLATFTNDKYLENAIFSEIYLLKRFNHPNIVKFKDVLSSKNSLYIITEFCKNGDLKEVLKKRKFKEDEAFEVIRQILNGFHELVRERIVHRDLKPANILIHEGVYKIGDFGFAKYVDNFGSQMLKSCVGSPIYMAPQILERTPYTTKCDIWSIGVIFYEMTHNSPPWKARDEAELLRGIKNVSISHILRKSQLGHRATEFLKRTLAYSEEERIGWTELFESYGSKYEKPQNESTEKVKASTREKQRVISANSNSNSHLSSHYSTQNGKMLPLTPVNPTSSSNTNVTSLGSIHSPALSPERKRNLFPPSTNSHTSSTLHSHTVSGTTNNSGSTLKTDCSEQKKSSQIENIIKWHQFLMFYHYHCVELLINLQTVVNFGPTKLDTYGRLLLCLSQLTKNRNTFCLSMIAIHSKTHKNAEELYKTMKAEHESYEMVYNDVVIGLEKQGLYKMLKTDLTAAVGHSEVINEDRMEKMESYMIENALENAKNIGDFFKGRDKDKKNGSIYNTGNKEASISSSVQILDSLLEILYLAFNKQKFNKGIEEILSEISFTEQEISSGYRRERRISGDFEIEKEWGGDIGKDGYGKSVIGKFEKVMSLVDSFIISNISTGTGLGSNPHI